MKRIYRIGLTTILLFSLFACGKMAEDKEDILQPSTNNSLQLMKLSSKGLTDQQPAIQAKEFLSERDDISRVRAVNHKDDLLVAIDVPHLKRLQLKEIQSEVQKEINAQFSNLNVTLSSDQKILIELKDLEQKIEADEIDEDGLQKRLDEIKKLSNEET